MQSLQKVESKLFANLKLLSISSFALFHNVKTDPKTKVPRSVRPIPGKKGLWEKVYKEAIQAQKKRVKWEYPVQGDQRASWKHRRWFDIYYEAWVDTYPDPPKDFNMFHKDRRTHLFNAETPNELFLFLLDTTFLRKFIIESFNHEAPIPNVSYYYQYLTHTKYVHGLPYSIHSASVDEESLSHFRTFVEDLLLMEHNNPSHSMQSDPLKRNHRIKEACMRGIMKYLITTHSSENVCLSKCEVDHNAENSLYWLRGKGFIKWTMPDDLSIGYQCHDPVLLQIRSDQRLPEFSPYAGNFSTTGEIPFFYTTPHVFRNTFVQYRNTITPGYRLYGGDCDQNYEEAYDENRTIDLPPPTYNSSPYGHTQMLLLPETYSRDWYNENLEHADITEEIEEHLKGHGIMSGWVWTAAQAHYASHWMDNDITQPYCSQSIVSDGKMLSFFCYQLNTIAIDQHNIDEHNKRNICFGKTSVKLYDDVTSDQVIGLNDEALQLLMKFVQNGQFKNQSSETDDEAIEAHNQSLHVQEVDPDKPEIELQMPLHKIEMKERRDKEEADRLAEKRKTMSVREKVKDTFSQLLP